MRGVGFIFYNSMQDAVTSEERSLAIVEQVKPILDADNSMTKKAFNDMIRALGAFAGVMIVKIGNGMKQYFATFRLT